MNILNIKEYVNQEMEVLKQQVNELIGPPPSLLIIDPTEGDPANQIYIKKKQEDFAKLGWRCDVIKVHNTYTLRKTIIMEVNNYDAMIVQMPCAPGIEFNPTWIPPTMDCDGLNPASAITPATVRGIIDYLDACNFDYVGKDAVVLGRSQIVGSPMAQALIKKDMTVTLCHSKTAEYSRNLALGNADLVVVATGRPHLISRNDVQPHTFVVDVGMSNIDGKWVGDFDEWPSEGECLSTPVPGGVGLLTRLGLLKNCYDLVRNKRASYSNEL